METKVDQMVRDLWALGVRQGGVLLVHSSLKALGKVEGGAAEVIRGLRQALGEEGTLLMPALSYELVTRRQPFFDIRNTPSNVGVIPETFRTLPGTLRSLHPTHSVCGVGKLAQTLLDPHALDNTPCGPNSPFRTLPTYQGQIIMLGCGLEPNTSMHAIEELVVPPYLYAAPINYRLALVDGSMQDKEYTPHSFRGWRQRYDRAAQVLSPPGLRQGLVLQAQAYLIESAALWEAALPALRRDPLYFVESEEVSH